MQPTHDSRHGLRYKGKSEKTKESPIDSRWKKLQEKSRQAVEGAKKGYASFCEAGRKVNDGFLAWFHRHDQRIYLTVITILAVVMRILPFPCVRGDYTGFLLPWYTNIYENGAAALGTPFGDYTPAYNYLLYRIGLTGICFVLKDFFGELNEEEKRYREAIERPGQALKEGQE